MEGENKVIGGDSEGSPAVIQGFDGCNVVTDEMGNVTVTVPAGGETMNKDPGVAAPVRPFPLLGHVLCQVCKRPTNSEVQNDLVDTPFVFSFNGMPRAILCYGCYLNGTMAAAFMAHNAIQQTSEATGIPESDLNCCGGKSCSDDLPHGSVNG